jgi:hypothetical protein
MSVFNNYNSGCSVYTNEIAPPNDDPNPQTDVDNAINTILMIFEGRFGNLSASDTTSFQMLLEVLNSPFTPFLLQELKTGNATDQKLYADLNQEDSSGKSILDLLNEPISMQEKAQELANDFQQRNPASPIWQFCQDLPYPGPSYTAPSTWTMDEYNQTNSDLEDIWRNQTFKIQQDLQQNPPNYAQAKIDAAQMVTDLQNALSNINSQLGGAFAALFSAYLNTADPSTGLTWNDVINMFAQGTSPTDSQLQTLFDFLTSEDGTQTLMLGRLGQLMPG